MCGLLARDWEFIQKSLSKFPEIERAILFGSRAMGNYKRGSDVDLAIVGEKVTHKTLVELNEWLNEIFPLPYVFDILHYQTILNQELQKHIDTHGKLIYQNQ
ncbi:nucleotidyltransferase domain-containing protein [Alicyclobacillus fodiniaquatilis]|jgi:predicted nucleotidyltransferase|uniref:Nucleotidyltransferase domain-containing protein n=1 Tax=Alicyclobacillus fodiniaquatilis TaxID=1661150 RepID=A0ABW4JR19_9BACL